VLLSRLLPAWYLQTNLDRVDGAVFAPNRAISFIGGLGTHSFGPAANMANVLWRRAHIELEFKLVLYLCLLFASTVCGLHKHLQVAVVSIVARTLLSSL